VVLLDIGLPRMDGHEVARRMRAETWSRGLRIIALTGWGQATDRQRSEAAGMDLHLLKPVDPNALHRVLMDATLPGVP
jgi:CheY-like chemotaxis protein